MNLPGAWHRVLRLIIAFVLLASPAWAEPAREVRIGVLANRGVDRAMSQWQPTAVYLGARLPDLRFSIVPLGFEQIAAAVAAGKVDYVLANPAVYVGLERWYHVSPIATLKNSMAGREYSLFGGVVLTRADSPIRSLPELRGKRFMAVDAISLGGYQAALRELQRHGLRRNDLGSLTFGHTHDAVVEAVMSGQVDAGTVRTDILERMATEGRIDLGQVRVLKDEGMGVAGFPFRHSTRLYPEWPFARLAHTAYRDAERVSAALLAMPADAAAALASGAAGWTVPLSYGSVHELLHELGLPPYEPEPEPTWRDTLKRYRNEVAAVATMLVASWLLLAYIARINRRLQLSRDQLNEANGRLHEKMLEQEALNRRLAETQSQLLQADKMASIGLLAAGVAHEINTPLGYITSNLGTLEHYTHDLLALLETYEQAESSLPADLPTRQCLEAIKTRVDPVFLRDDCLSLVNETRQGLMQVRRIVQGLRDFSHPDESQWQWADLNRGMEATLSVVGGEIKPGIDVVREYGDVPPVQCQAQQINQVFLNLVLNALHAMGAQGRLTVCSGGSGDEVWMEVRDTGCGIDPAHMAHIFDPFFTTKPVGHGTGLGLSICYGIVQKHHGRIDVGSEPGQGTRFRVVLPVKQPA